MIDLVQAIVKFVQSPSNKMKGFIGSNTSGNNLSYGPFLGVAPQGTEFPYMVYNILPNALDQGFNFPYTSYGENPQISFNLYDDDIDNLSANLKTFIKRMDTIMSSDFLFNTSDEECNTIYRTVNPTMLHEPVDKSGKRVYHAVIDYTYHCSENKGVDD
jgi:hypothetical protein